MAPKTPIVEVVGVSVALTYEDLDVNWDLLEKRLFAAGAKAVEGPLVNGLLVATFKNDPRSNDELVDAVRKAGQRPGRLAAEFRTRR